MPLPTRAQQGPGHDNTNQLDHDDDENLLIVEEYSHERVSQARLAEMENSLNHDQRHAYEQIMGAYLERRPQVFFIDGPAGTGKTYFYELILAKVRLNGHVALAVASSGIAALLLLGGQGPLAIRNPDSSLRYVQLLYLAPGPCYRLDKNHQSHRLG